MWKPSYCWRRKPGNSKGFGDLGKICRCVFTGNEMDKFIRKQSGVRKINICAKLNPFCM